VGEVFTYLGGSFTIQGGLVNDVVYNGVMDASTRIGRLALKPMQKLELLYTYVLPGFYHLMIADPPSLPNIRLLDSALRRLVRVFFHLPSDVNDAFFHTRKADGGLGLPRLEHLVRAANVKAFAACLRIDDPVLRVFLDDNLLGKIQASAESIGLPWPPSNRDIINWKYDQKKAAFAAWSALPSQGKGIRSFKGNRVGNSWLYADELFPGQVIDLIRLRTNTFPTLEYLARQQPRDSIACRRCSLRDETLGHVLGECPAGRPGRLARHDRVVDEVEGVALENGLVVAKEQLFTPDPSPEDPSPEPLRPDLVIVSPDSALVVDVTVRMEQDNSLAEAALEKTRKYSTLDSVIQRRFNVTSFKVLPIVIGARGGLPAATVRAFREVGISDNLRLKSIINKVLSSSISIARAHIDMR
jgi:hypothetical protein